MSAGQWKFSPFLIHPIICCRFILLNWKRSESDLILSPFLLCFRFYFKQTRIQLHDIPCQSACLSVVSACQRQVPYAGCQSSAYSSSSTIRNSLWPIGSGSYLNQIGASPNSAYLYPYGGNVFSAPYARYSGMHGSYLSRRSGRESYTNRVASARRHTYTSEPTFSQEKKTQSEQGQQWHQLQRIRRNVLRPNPEYLVGSSSNTPLVGRMASGLTDADCYLLPSGGCDKMATQLVETDQYTSTSIEHNVRSELDLDTILHLVYHIRYHTAALSTQKFNPLVLISNKVS